VETLRELRMSRQPGRLLGFAYGPDLRLEAVGSAAEAAGGEVGQEIISVNGVRVRSQGEADAAFASAPQTFSVVVLEKPSSSGPSQTSLSRPQQGTPVSPPSPKVSVRSGCATAATRMRSLSPAERVSREIAWRDPISPGRGKLTKVEQFEHALHQRHALDVIQARLLDEEMAAEAKARAVLAQADKDRLLRDRQAQAVAARELEAVERRERVHSMREQARARQAAAGKEAAAARSYAKEAGSCTFGSTVLSPSPSPVVLRRFQTEPSPSLPVEVSRSISPQRLERPRWR